MLSFLEKNIDRFENFISQVKGKREMSKVIHLLVKRRFGAFTTKKESSEKVYCPFCANAFKTPELEWMEIS